jgi:hypothetical protein
VPEPPEKSSWLAGSGNWALEVEARKETTRFDIEKTQKREIDSLMTVLSNCASPFVCNKTSTPGWGLAEGHRQRAAKVGFADLGPSFAANAAALSG